jgi:hypothetical protein
LSDGSKPARPGLFAQRRPTPPLNATPREEQVPRDQTESLLERGSMRTINLECADQSALPLSDRVRFVGRKAAASRRTSKSQGFHFEQPGVAHAGSAL